MPAKLFSVVVNGDVTAVDMTWPSAHRFLAEHPEYAGRMVLVVPQ